MFSKNSQCSPPVRDADQIEAIMTAFGLSAERIERMRRHVERSSNADNEPERKHAGRQEQG
jgi:hypothetical protein